MTSPQDPQNQAQPLTPPADPPTNLNPTGQPLPTSSLPSHPPISTTLPPHTKRPRDARIIHLILASLGVSAYQERVPLQLLDFAYRYTSSVLSDAAHIQAEGWDTSGDGSGGANAGTTGKARGRVGTGATGATGGAGGGTSGAGPGAASGEKEDVSLASLRIAIGSRMQYQYQASLPKEFLLGLAKERNRIGLGVGRGNIPNLQDPAAASTAAASQMIGGVKLPPERYCLTGVGWGVREEWDSEGEEEISLLQQQQSQNGNGNAVYGSDAAAAGGRGDGDEGMADADDAVAEEEDEDDDDDGARMEDIFGDGDGDRSGDADGNAEGGGGDEHMRDA
jgi:transcription initiation factor TFIID subunit 9B